MMKTSVSFATNIKYACVLIVLHSAVAFADPIPRPALSTVFPAGGKAGATVEVVVAGSDFDGARMLAFDHPGIRATLVKDTTFRVTIAADVPVGVHEVRVISALGVSNPRAFVVGRLNESVEREPNATFEAATPIKLGSTVNGRIDGQADIDWFMFEGEKGNRVHLEIEAARIDSALDAAIRAFGPDRGELAVRTEVDSGDPFVEIVLPATGRYYVRIQDVIFNGSNEHIYRLTASLAPRIDAIIPRSAVPGTTSEFELIGRNLGGTIDPSLSIEGEPIERRTVTIDVPKAISRSNDPGLGSTVRVPLVAAGRSGFEYRLETPQGVSNAVFLAFAADRVTIEREPNDGGKNVQIVDPPCEISGTFARIGEIDRYRFRAKKGEVLVVEADAERFGSPADPFFTIEQITAQGDPRELAVGDDRPEASPSPGFPGFPAASVDASVRFVAPDDGLYQISLHDLYESGRGDARFQYVLKIRPERPDFRLIVAPGEPSFKGGLCIDSGGRSIATVIAQRIDGFNDPIYVDVIDHPPGVSCDPAIIPAGSNRTVIVASADRGAPASFGAIVVRGRGRFADRKDVLNYVPGITRLTDDRDRIAESAAIVRLGDQQRPPILRMARQTIAAATGRAAPLAVIARNDRRIVVQGGSIPIDFEVRRDAGLESAVSVVIHNPPPVAGFAGISFKAKETRGSADLAVAQSTPPGSYTFYFQGASSYPFSKDPNAKEKTNVDLNVPSNLVEVDVVPRRVAVSIDPRGFNAVRGGELEVPIKITRENGFTGPVLVDFFSKVGDRLTARPVEIAADRTDGVLNLGVSQDLKPGPVLSAKIRVTTTFRGATADSVHPVGITIVDKPIQK